jgi:hypothetical protein
VAHYARHPPEDQDDAGNTERNRGRHAPFRYEAVTGIAPVLAPPEERAAPQASPMSALEFALAVEPDLRTGELGQHLRVDGRRFDGEPGERRWNRRRREVHLALERCPDALSGFGEQGDLHRNCLLLLGASSGEE